MNKSTASPIMITLPAQLEVLINGPLYSVAEWRAKSKSLEKQAGLYAFWWIGDPAVLRRDELVEFVGPAGDKGGDAQELLYDPAGKPAFGNREYLPLRW
jgi:hypothetical protein